MNNSQNHHYGGDLPVYVLRHIETDEFVCLHHDQHEYMVAFSERTTADQFRDEAQLLEHVDIVQMPLSLTPFDHYWMDGQLLNEETASLSG